MFKDLTPAKAFALCGFMTAIVLGGGSLVAILLDPTWNITQNSFSDLGCTESFATMVTFNGICAVAGMFLCAFSLGYIIYGRRFAKIGGAVLLMDSVVLVFVGVYSKQFDFDLHLYMSMAFATLFLIGATFICVQDVIDGNWKYVIPIALAGLVVGIVWMLYLFVMDVPYGVAQIFSFGAAFVWFLSETVKNLRLGIGTEERAVTA